MMDQDRVSWRFMGLYGDLRADHRRFSWELIKRVRSLYPDPFLVGGDLNEVAANSKLSGERTREPHLIEAFRGMMEECELNDLGFVGDSFTWRRKASTGLGEGRLDRCLADSEWESLYPRSKIFHLDFWSSDHRPIL